MKWGAKAPPVWCRRNGAAAVTPSDRIYCLLPRDELRDDELFAD
jgi:hypothetical protein